jgi:hypothetical protein
MSNWTKTDISIAKNLREQKKSLQEIGDLFNVSRERIRQIIGNTGRINKYFEGFKRCYSCHKTLPFSDFYESKSKGRGAKHTCRKCLKAHSLKWGRIYAYKYSKGGKYFKKSIARMRLGQAVKAGKIVKTDCIVGKDCYGRIEGHHYAGYGKES